MAILDPERVRENEQRVEEISASLPLRSVRRAEHEFYFFFLCSDIPEALARREKFVEAGYEAHWENIVGSKKFNLLVYAEIPLHADAISARECRILSVAQSFASDYVGWELQRPEEFS